MLSGSVGFAQARPGAAPDLATASAQAIAAAQAAPSTEASAKTDTPRAAAAAARPVGAVDAQLLSARGELLTLPPLRDLLEIATSTTPQARKIALAQAQEAERAKLWKLANWDVVSLQALAIGGRRDVFAINTDGSVYVPNASVVDNTNLQASLLLKVSPVSFFQNRRQVEVTRLERERLAAEGEAVRRDVAEGVIYAYNMAQKSLDLMDARATAHHAVEARAELAERQFRQGAMSLAEYAEFQSKASDMAAKFQDARGDFRLYYQLLMERVYGRVP